MRSITILFGLFACGLSAFADQAVLHGPVIKYSAPYIFNPGRSSQESREFKVIRQLNFYFPNSSVDGESLKPDSDSMIYEFRKEDIKRAKSEAYKISENSDTEYEDALAAKIRDLLDPQAPVHARAVDCRLVAKRMVQNLIKNRVEVINPGERERHVYKSRQNDLYKALAAKNLSDVTIVRGSNKYPICEVRNVDGEEAGCGSLVLNYQPQKKPAESVLAGLPAIEIDLDYCAKQHDMSPQACVDLFDITACGLHDANKASTLEMAKNPGKNVGLSDKLESMRDWDIKALQEPRRAGSKAAASAAKPAIPANFFDGFGDKSATATK
jgi:hypothetical protein